MKILVTGGMGEIGKPTVQWLAARGHAVRVLDLRVPEPIPGVDCREGDVTDLEALRAALDGIEGVVHLAAYRHPSMASNSEMFRVNALGTMNVFHAAAEAGIRRVVCASSINALGYNFGIKFPPGQLQYFPIDEAHPTFTTDAYSFSKRIIEEIGAYFWRREGVSSVFLRLPAVFEIAGEATARVRAFIDGVRAQTEALLALPETERRAEVATIIAGFEALRAQRAWEHPGSLKRLREVPNALAMFGRSNFWASIDARDSAQAIEKGLLADYEGSHPLYVNDSHNFVGVPTETLAALFFPEVTMWKRPVQGTETLVSIDKARELLGFEPEYSVSRWF